MDSKSVDGNIMRVRVSPSAKVKSMLEAQAYINRLDSEVHKIAETENNAPKCGTKTRSGLLCKSLAVRFKKRYCHGQCTSNGTVPKIFSFTPPRPLH